MPLEIIVIKNEKEKKSKSPKKVNELENFLMDKDCLFSNLFSQFYKASRRLL